MTDHITIRQLPAEQITRIAEIDRTEHVTLGYTVKDGAIHAEAVDWRVPPWRPEGTGPHSVRQMIDDWGAIVEAGGVLLGAMDGERMAGVAILRYQLTPTMAQLAVLQVSKEYRRMGIGERLLREVELLAKADGATALYVSATPSESAVGFYTHQGFRLTSQPHPELLAQEPEDIHMVKPLVIVLQTERLYVRPWLETDLAPLRHLLTDPQVCRHYSSDGQPHPEAEIVDIWEWGLHTRSGHTPGFFNCPLVYRETGEMIGRAGINPLWTPETGADPNEPEMEWALLPAYWGHGLATELGHALIAYGFDVAEFDHLIAFTSPQNVASQRVMQKIGMTLKGCKIIRGEECVVYRVERNAYSAGVGTT